MSIFSILAMTGMMSGGFMDFDMDMTGKKLGETLEKEGLLHYDQMDIHSRIDFKAMIDGDKATMRAMSHRMDMEEFEILKLIKMTSCWRMCINTMLHKWQHILKEKEEEKTEAK